MALLDSSLEAALEGLTDHTKATYRSPLKRWVAWCAQQDPARANAVTSEKLISYFKAVLRGRALKRGANPGELDGSVKRLKNGSGQASPSPYQSLRATNGDQLDESDEMLEPDVEATSDGDLLTLLATTPEGRTTHDTAYKALLRLYDYQVRAGLNTASDPREDPTLWRFINECRKPRTLTDNAMDFEENLDEASSLARIPSPSKGKQKAVIAAHEPSPELEVPRSLVERVAALEATNRELVKINKKLQEGQQICAELLLELLGQKVPATGALVRFPAPDAPPAMYQVEPSPPPAAPLPPVASTSQAVEPAIIANGTSAAALNGHSVASDQAVAEAATKAAKAARRAARRKEKQEKAKAAAAAAALVAPTAVAATKVEPPKSNPSPQELEAPIPPPPPPRASTSTGNATPKKLASLTRTAPRPSSGSPSAYTSKLRGAPSPISLVTPTEPITNARDLWKEYRRSKRLEKAGLEPSSCVELTEYALVLTKVEALSHKFDVPASEMARRVDGYARDKNLLNLKSVCDHFREAKDEASLNVAIITLPLRSASSSAGQTD